jgi:hypothetical protein
LYGSFIEMPGKRVDCEKPAYYYGTEGVLRSSMLVVVVVVVVVVQGFDDGLIGLLNS